jgi:hypothetical protein
VRKNLTHEEWEELEVPPIPDDLTGEDRQALVDAHNEAVYDAIAPHIIDWNFGYVDEDGNEVKADPPAVAGGAQLPRFLSDRLIGQIYWDLRLRSTGLVKAKSSTPLEVTDITSGDSSSTPTGTED